MDKISQYEELEEKLNEEAKKILFLIKQDYYTYMSEKKKALINMLIERDNIVVNQGVSIYKDNTFAHGGRTLRDDKIHFFPDVRNFMSNDELLVKCKNLLPHELFHFFLQPDEIKFYKTERKKKIMAEAYTEGLVEKETRRFCKRHSEISFERSNYGANISFVNSIQRQLHADSLDIIFSENDYLKNIGTYEKIYDNIENRKKDAIDRIKKLSKQLPENLRHSFYEKARTLVLQDENVTRYDLDTTKLYTDSVILIGPSGAGKSTVAQELSKIMHVPRFCLDRVANRNRDFGVMKHFESVDEYNACMINILVELAELIGAPEIVDFGAGHSVYDDSNKFNEVKNTLSKFKNVVLLLPSTDLEKSLKILENRSTGDYTPNRKFITSPCNRELATMTVYENNRTPGEIANEIIRNIDKNKRSEEYRNIRE